MTQFFATPTTQDTRGDRGTTTRRKAKTNRGAEGAWIAEMKEALGPKVWVRQVWFRCLITTRWVSPRTGEATDASHYEYAPTRERLAGYVGQQERNYPDGNGWALVSVGEVEEYTRDVVQHEREAGGVVVERAAGRIGRARTRWRWGWGSRSAPTPRRPG